MSVTYHNLIFASAVQSTFLVQPRNTVVLSGDSFALECVPPFVKSSRTLIYTSDNALFTVLSDYVFPTYTVQSAHLADSNNYACVQWISPLQSRYSSNATVQVESKQHIHIAHSLPLPLPLHHSSHPSVPYHHPSSPPHSPPTPHHLLTLLPLPHSPPLTLNSTPAPLSHGTSEHDCSQIEWDCCHQCQHHLCAKGCSNAAGVLLYKPATPHTGGLAAQWQRGDHRSGYFHLPGVPGCGLL